MSLGRAAAPARQRVLSGSTVRRLVFEVDPEVAVEVPEQVRVQTAYREITPEFVRSPVERAIRYKLPWPGAAVRLAGWRLPEPFPVPVRAQRVVVHFRGEESFLRRVHTEIELVSPDATLPRIRRSVSVSLSVKLPVVVTAVDLRRGAVLEPGSLELQERDLGGLPRNVLRDLEQAAGLQLARGLARGTPLLPGYLRSEARVRRGDSVSVRMEGAGLQVRLEARALEAGSLGETIRVENRKTRYRFQAEVTGPGTARMQTAGVGSGR